MYLRLASILSVAVSLAGCDRGYQMTPAGMGGPDDQGLWHKKYEQFELGTKALGGLVGEYWLDPELQISADTDPIIIESVNLETSSGSYPANIGAGPITIDAFAKNMPIHIRWDFARQTPAPEIMGRSARIVFRVKVRSAEEVSELRYEKTQCCKYYP